MWAAACLPLFFLPPSSFGGPGGGKGEKARRALFRDEDGEGGVSWFERSFPLALFCLVFFQGGGRVGVFSSQRLLITTHAKKKKEKDWGERHCLPSTFGKESR